MAKLADLIEQQKELFASIDAWDNGEQLIAYYNSDRGSMVICIPVLLINFRTI